MQKKPSLTTLIERELLIQEAQRQGLDRKKSFMGTIERYWKQTLVKELLQTESQRFKDSTDTKSAQEALSNWIKELIQNAQITINEEALNSIGN